MGIKIWIDDLRAMPLWCTHWAKTYNQAIEILSIIDPSELENVSFDHDLGACEFCVNDDAEQMLCGKDCECPCHKTGYHVALWMEEHDVWPKWRPTVHSANPVGAARIRVVIQRKYGNETKL